MFLGSVVFLGFCYEDFLCNYVWWVCYLLECLRSDFFPEAIFYFVIDDPSP